MVTELPERPVPGFARAHLIGVTFVHSARQLLCIYIYIYIVFDMLNVPARQQMNARV